MRRNAASACFRFMEPRTRPRHLLLVQHLCVPGCRHSEDSRGQRIYLLAFRTTRHPKPQFQRYTASRRLFMGTLNPKPYLHSPVEPSKAEPSSSRSDTERIGPRIGPPAIGASILGFMGLELYIGFIIQGPGFYAGFIG